MEGGGLGVGVGVAGRGGAAGEMDGGLGEAAGATRRSRGDGRRGTAAMAAGRLARSNKTREGERREVKRTGQPSSVSRVEETARGRISPDFVHY